MHIRIAGIERQSVVDGPGIRFVIFGQGCPHRCKGCHNVETWSRNGGSLTDTGEIFRLIRGEKMLRGITFSGGEPFEQPAAFAELADLCHSINLDVFVYTGYTWEALLEHAAYHDDFKNLISQADFLVDGRYLHEQRTLSMPFRGSKNQRLIDVQRSLNEGEAVEVEAG